METIKIPGLPVNASRIGLGENEQRRKIYDEMAAEASFRELSWEERPFDRAKMTDDGRKTQLAWMGAKHRLGLLILLGSMRRGVAALHFFSDSHDCSSNFFTAQAILR